MGNVLHSSSNMLNKLETGMFGIGKVYKLNIKEMISKTISEIVLEIMVGGPAVRFVSLLPCTLRMVFHMVNCLLH